MDSYTQKQWQTISEKLTEPFPDEQVEWVNVGGGEEAAYIDARIIMDRFDATVGPAWSTSYVVINPLKEHIECTITIQGISKADVGTPNSGKDVDDPKRESCKSAYTDAFKRAAVQWGVGRFLYHLDTRPTTGRKPVENTTNTTQRNTLVQDIYATALTTFKGDKDAAKGAIEAEKTRTGVAGVGWESISIPVIQAINAGIHVLPQPEEAQPEQVQTESRTVTKKSAAREAVETELRAICVEKYDNKIDAMVAYVESLKEKRGYGGKTGDDVPLTTLQSMLEEAKDDMKIASA